MFENDRDALHTSQTQKRRNIRGCRDLVWEIPDFHECIVCEGDKIVEYIDEWKGKQGSVID